MRRVLVFTVFCALAMCMGLVTDVSAQLQTTQYGTQAGESNTGDFGALFGYRAGRSNTGDGNTFLGWLAGPRATGRYNMFLGASAGYLNTSGFENVFIGESAGVANSTGYQNLYLGRAAGFANVTGLRNVSIGAASSLKTVGGSFNTVIGTFAYQNAASGSNNTVIGYNAGNAFNGYDGNTAIGYEAGKDTNGAFNIFLGGRASATTTVSSSMSVGYGARATANNQIVFGGGSTGKFTSMYVGNGVSHAAPVDFTIYSTSASTGDVDGGDLILQGGAKSGAGTDGIVKANCDFEVNGDTTTKVLEITGGADLSEQFDIAPAGQSAMVALLLEHGAK